MVAVSTKSDVYVIPRGKVGGNDSKACPAKTQRGFLKVWGPIPRWEFGGGDNNFCLNKRDSANAVPHYHKLRTRVTHIWGDRKGQPNRSAVVRPHSGGTAFMITVAPVPGKYA